eukprot:gene293-2394_t
MPPPPAPWRTARGARALAVSLTIVFFHYAIWDVCTPEVRQAELRWFAPDLAPADSVPEDVKKQVLFTNDLATALRGFGAMATAPLMGWLADEYGRWPVFLAYEISILLPILALMSFQNIWVYVGALTLHGCFGSGSAIWGATMMDLTSDGNASRQTAQLLVRGVGTTGAVSALGPAFPSVPCCARPTPPTQCLASLAFSAFHVTFQGIFQAASAAGVVLIGLFWLLPETMHLKARSHKPWAAASPDQPGRPSDPQPRKRRHGMSSVMMLARGALPNSRPLLLISLILFCSAGVETARAARMLHRPAQVSLQ